MKDVKIIIRVVLGILFLLSYSLLVAQVDEYPHVVDNGGGYASSISYDNLASIGQAVSSVVSDEAVTNQVGYVNTVFTPTVGIAKKNQKIKPANFILNQNYPNPFNAATQIEFQLPIDSNVHFCVYNLLGEKVIQINENKPAGIYVITVDSDRLPAGLYLYSLKAGKFAARKQMLLLK